MHRQLRRLLQWGQSLSATLLSSIPAPLWRLRPSSKHTWAFLFAVGITLSVAIPSYASATGGGFHIGARQNDQLISQQPRQVDLTLVSFAVTRAAYDRIIPQFTRKWARENNGQVVRFRTSYGGSGSQTRAVLDGLDADVVALALEGDVNRLQQGGLINSGWQREAPNNSIVAKSVSVLVTRAGNPKNIRTWRDLAKPDVRVITADPKTSGVARWNFLALWGSVTETGGTEAQARQFVGQVYRNVPVLPRDAREATDIFLQRGQGDVLINYENELLLAQLQRQATNPYIIPAANISIDVPVAVVDRNVDRKGTRRVAEAFVQYLFTPEAQREFARVGFRPVNAQVARENQRRFPSVAKLFTVADFGGWDQVQRRFFADGAIFDQIRRQR
jgi:sulfate/thiosulfate-binding protein